MDTFERVRHLLVRIVKVSEDEVTLETCIVGDLGADSLAAVEIVAALEHEFALEFPDELSTVSEGGLYLMSSDTTVQQIVDYIERMKKAP
jgi:acyl carrier protein